MDAHIADLFRRSRPQHRRAAGKLAKKGLVGMDKRLTPEQMSAIQASESAFHASRQAGETPATTPQRNPATPITAGATEAVGGAASRVQSASAAPTTAASSSPAPASSSARPSSSAVPSSSSVRPSSSSATPSTMSTRSTTTSSSTPSSRSVMTVTSSRASSSSSASPSASASAAAASSSSTSTGMSTGAIAGIALATLVGLVVLGSIVGWFYRKHAQRKYAAPKQPWSKLDDDITPFPHGGSEKPYPSPDDDIYGHSQAPVIGSRRALALARDNTFRQDGSLRPDSDYMMARDHPNNRAGLGATNGLGHQYGAYPAMHSPAMHSPGGYDYGRPAHGYEQDQMPHSPASQNYEPGMAVSAPGNMRQLLGPGGQPQGYGMPMPAPVPLGPVAMGRPAPPQSAAEFADREEFMDLPAPAPAALAPRSGSSGAHLSQYSTYGLAYADSEPDYMPHTATTTGWAGDVKVPSSSSQAPAPLPQIEPASPLMSGFDFNKRQSQPLGPIAANFASKYGPGAAASSTLPMYQDEDESSRQKRMYGEVAHAAGVQEPVTPHTATDLSRSTDSYETASSFSAHEPGSRSVSGRLPQAPMSVSMPPPPVVNLTPPQPYQHGQPLSPLPEVETPMSTTAGGVPLTSSSLMHGQEVNPFEQVASDQSLLATPRAHALRPPHSAVSSTGATSFPSPRFPPPSPGGMSLPGSVTDSPRGNKRESMFDGDDAYGGI